VLSAEMERYKALYEKAVHENNVFMGHTNHGQKIRYVVELKQQINDLLEENHSLTMKTANLNHSVYVNSTKAAKHHL
jgi:regulator of replication initiation timing